MSSTLGEKLKNAREARGVTISEVAEQTRISALYLESIENNDYRTLPGGIFNKGFVKSYAKYVGLDEQEALKDYSSLISEQGESQVEEVRTYRPEVLTDDRTSSSMLPTLIIAAVILGLLTWAVISLVNYLNVPKETAINNPANKVANTNSSEVNSNAANSNGTPVQTSFSPDSMNIQFKSTSTEPQKPNLTTWLDGSWESYTFQGDEPKSYTPKQTLKVLYSKWQVKNLQLTINGKPITLPQQPLIGKGQGIVFEINKGNAAAIYNAGAITPETVAAAPVASGNTNVANVATTNTAPAVAKPTMTPAPKPTVAPVEVTPRPATPKPVVSATVPNTVPTPNTPVNKAQ